MVNDMLQLQDIFASHVTAAVFVYGTAAMIFANAVLAVALSLRGATPGATGLLPRRAI